MPEANKLACSARPTNTNMFQMTVRSIRPLTAETELLKSHTRICEHMALLSHMYETLNVQVWRKLNFEWNESLHFFNNLD